MKLELKIARQGFRILGGYAQNRCRTLIALVLSTLIVCAVLVALSRATAMPDDVVAPTIDPPTSPYEHYSRMAHDCDSEDELGCHHVTHDNGWVTCVRPASGVYEMHMYDGRKWVERIDDWSLIIHEAMLCDGHHSPDGHLPS